MNKSVEPTIKFSQHADGQHEILIYGVIGDNYWDEVNSGSFFEQMQAINGEDVTVRINSYGGSVVAGTAIHTMLALHKGKVTAQIDGYAMSMASVIAMAADEIEISEIGGLMIHSPWTFAAGNADDLRKEADVLDGMEASLVNAYHSKTGIDKAELAAMLKEETWIYAKEAVERGFANRTIKPIKASACFDKSIESKLQHMPASLASFIALQTEDAPDDVNDATDNTDEAVEDDINETQEDVNDNVSLESDEPDAPITSSDEATSEEENSPTDERAQEKARSKGIIAACKAAGLPHLAEKYIDKDYSIDTVKSLLIEIKAGIEEQPPTAVAHQAKPNASNSTALWGEALNSAGINTKSK